MSAHDIDLEGTPTTTWRHRRVGKIVGWPIATVGEWTYIRLAEANRKGDAGEPIRVRTEFLIELGDAA